MCLRLSSIETFVKFVLVAKLKFQFYLPFGPSVLRATSGLSEQLRETTIFGIFPLGVVLTLLAFTPEGIVAGF